MTDLLLYILFGLAYAIGIAVISLLVFAGLLIVALWIVQFPTQWSDEE